MIPFDRFRDFRENFTGFLPPWIPPSGRIKYGTVSETCTTIVPLLLLFPRFTLLARTCIHKRFLSRDAVSSPYISLH